MNKRIYRPEEHTFAICAYGESPYLEACILSIMNQTIHSNVILTTATPNQHIKELCEKYQIPCYVNEGEKGITQDWNYAYSCCNTEILTLAHQDDIYFPEYTEMLLKAANRKSTPLIFFTDYSEIRENVIVHDNVLLKIKRVMLTPLRISALQYSRWLRRRILSLGSPICCPSVAYFRSNLPQKVFRNHFRTNEDWEAWEYLSRLKGAFIYCPKVLMGHRIHTGSETSAMIAEHGRTEEDFEMYCKFWPKWIARKLCKLYGKSELSNQL